MKEIYLESSVPLVKRLLGLCDRNPSSSTYGCFDRNYWHYKIVDFSNGRQQEACLTLALSHIIEHPSNPYCRVEKMREWSLAAIQYLATIQNKDGSFNEYYPHEHAFVTTAFTTFAASESLLLLNESPPEVVEALLKAGKFLLRREELEVVNQMLGACAALFNLYRMTGDDHYREGAEAKLKASLQRQSGEGWFYEYGGPDVGYLSVAAYYLANYYSKSHDEKALSSLKKAVHFLSHFVHPDGSAGGEYGSRNTTYLIPDGIEICAQHDPVASGLARKLRASLQENRSLAPCDLDDRYLCNMLYTYLQAFKDSSLLKEETEVESNFFPESGIVVKKTPDYFFIGNLRKGGVFKLFSGEKLVLSDSGFLGRLHDGRLITSQWLGTTFEEGSQYLVRGSFVEVPEQYMTPLKTVALRASLSVGGTYVSDFAKTYLRNRLITGRKEVPMTCERKITLEEGVQVQDVIQGTMTMQSLFLVSHAPLIYIPSSRYFQSNELECNGITDFSEKYNKEKKIKIERTYLRGCLTASTA